MKQLLTIILLCVGLFGFGQNVKLKLSANVNGTGDTVKLNAYGNTLKKGDTLVLYVAVNGNSNTVARQLYFDFEYQNTALTLLSITNTGTAGNGGTLPAGSQISESYYQYPGYRFAQNSTNTTSNGNTNYQYANYHEPCSFDAFYQSNKYIIPFIIHFHCNTQQCYLRLLFCHRSCFYLNFLISS